MMHNLLSVVGHGVVDDNVAVGVVDEVLLSLIHYMMKILVKAVKEVPQIL